MYKFGSAMLSLSISMLSISISLLSISISMLSISLLGISMLSKSKSQVVPIKVEFVRTLTILSH